MAIGTSTMSALFRRSAASFRAAQAANTMSAKPSMLAAHERGAWFTPTGCPGRLDEPPDALPSASDG